MQSILKSFLYPLFYMKSLTRSINYSETLNFRFYITEHTKKHRNRKSVHYHYIPLSLCIFLIAWFTDEKTNLHISYFVGVLASILGMILAINKIFMWLIIARRSSGISE